MKNSQQIMKILVVDDEKDIRDGCERILIRMECEVKKASRGEEALETMETWRPSIVFLDLKMPGIDGMEVLRRIHEKDQDILVIVITGYATVETAIEAMKKGAYDFVPKPFEPAQLRIVAGRAIEKLRLRQEALELELKRQRTLADLGKEQSRTRTIIEALPNGVVVTNTEGQVVLMNPAFIRHLGLPPDTQPGNFMKDYVSDEGVVNLAMEISQGKFTEPDQAPAVEFALSEDKYLMARGRPVLSEDGECLGAVVVMHDVTAMKMLDRLKSEFVAKVSHELRSPLATIREQLALVIQGVVDEASEQDQYLLSRAKDKTQSLIDLIGDLLDVSRIECGSVAQQPVPLQVEELLASIVDFMKAKAGAKKQSLDIILPPAPLPKMRMDPMALESVVGNLVANAINYTPDGGAITVEVGGDEKTIKVTVADTGFGIEEKHLASIFDKFYRVKNDKTRFITGTGLGLSIVKGILDSMGATISVDSEVGKGSRFTVLLPLEESCD
ncbi:MAG: response regulator [Desulfatibacillum sp.]|nr:response regulator [Desulfatibacillum sp.]